MHFADDALRVKHSIVCRPYGLSGVKGVLSNHTLSLVDNWLAQMQICEKYQSRLDNCADARVRRGQLRELTVIERVRNACESTVVIGLAPWPESEDAGTLSWRRRRAGARAARRMCCLADCAREGYRFAHGGAHIRTGQHVV